MERAVATCWDPSGGLATFCSHRRSWCGLPAPLSSSTGNRTARPGACGFGLTALVPLNRLSKTMQLASETEMRLLKLATLAGKRIELLSVEVRADKKEDA